MAAAIPAAVFLSYASQDAEVARRICEALRAAGVEVWFDQNELVGGDAWDAKIRGQVAACALFVPVISAATQARHEGYFRLEWKLAAQRTHMMSGAKAFLLPVVIDATRDTEAHVPEEFRAVQWTRLPGGEQAEKFGERVKRLLGGGDLPVRPEVGARFDRAQSGRGPAAPLKWIFSAWTWGATIAVVAGIATAMWVGRKPPAVSAPAARRGAELAGEKSAALDPKAIAVLPFANLSTEKDNEFFSDGLSENILDRLASMPGLRVMGRTSSFSYKGRNASVTQIAQELRVGTLIEGSVQRAGSRLLIKARLTNTVDGTQAWSESFDRELTTSNIFALQDEIALKIAARLAPNSLVAATLAEERPTANLAAYEAYLRGRSMDTKGLGGQSRLLAVPFYEEAVRLDPGFALAWAHLAHSLAWIHWGSGEIAGDEFERAQRALAAAARLQPDLAEMHLARAAFLKCDGVNLSEAAVELALAERRKPNDPEIALEQALVARFAGRLEEALEFCRRSIERDPQNPNVYNTRGLVLNFLGRYPEALAAFDQATTLSFTSNPHSNRARTILRAEGDARKALREFERVTREQVDVQLRVDRVQVQMAGRLYSAALAEIESIEQPAALTQWGYQVRALLAARVKEQMGDAEGARRGCTEALPLARAYRDQHPKSWRAYPALAQAYAGLGKKDEALAAAREALRLVPPTENPYYAQLITLPILVDVQARFGQIEEALATVRQQIAAGWWRRNDLLLGEQFFTIRQDPRFRAIAEQAPL